MSDSNLPLWDVLRNWWDILQEVDTRTSTIVVSASNSIDPTLAPAAYRCSGAADEVEINAALTAAAAAGGEVLLLEGLYVTAAPITFPGNNLVLGGLGRATLIRSAAAAGNAINVTGRDDVIIRDLAIDTKTSASGGHCIFIEDGSDRFRVENVWVIDSDTDGIRVEGTTIDTGHIEGCHILNADRAGIVVDMDAANFMYRLNVDGNNVWNCGTEGIRFSTSGGNHYCTVTNNIVLDALADGIILVDSDYSIVQGNTSISNGGDGIVLVNSDYSIVQGNTSISNDGDGIEVNSTVNAHVLGNTCQGNAGNGIYLSNTSANTNVVGNNCPGNTGSGIYLDSSSGCNVTGNTCQGNTTIGIYVVSSHDSTLIGNNCLGNGNSGILLSSSNGCNVTGNTSQGNTRHGIYVSSSNDGMVVGNACNANDSGDTGTYDGISLSGSTSNLIKGNQCRSNDRWGIMVDAASDYNKVSNNYTNGNTSGSIRVNNANCDNTQIEFNTVEEGAPSDAGTLTRSYGNYDPSANAFVGDVGAAPF